jgi:hypothetical protein
MFPCLFLLSTFHFQISKLGFLSFLGYGDFQDRKVQLEEDEVVQWCFLIIFSFGSLQLKIEKKLKYGSDLISSEFIYVDKKLEV